jgi:hypothetical protein
VSEMPNLEDECFFITPIGEEGSDTRRRSDGVLRFIVEPAASEAGLVAIRADKIDQPGQITLQIIEHVLKAKAVVADLTGLNPNVFYELAIRHTARLPVVLIADKGQELPFDVLQMRTIFFDHRDLQSAAACKDGIATHLRQALDGAVDSPVATAVDVQALQAGNKVERSIAEVIAIVEDLAKGQRNVQMGILDLRRNLVAIPFSRWELPANVAPTVARALKLSHQLPDDDPTAEELRLRLRILAEDLATAQPTQDIISEFGYPYRDSASQAMQSALLKLGLLEDPEDDGPTTGMAPA